MDTLFKIVCIPLQMAISIFRKDFRLDSIYKQIKTMNTLKSIVVKLGSFSLKTVLTLLVCGMTLPALGQLKWSSYDTSGNLVAANIATGGDIASGGSVTFTIPASTQLFFVTKGFVPFSLTTPSSVRSISFKMSASGGLTGVTSGQRIIGFGLYNSAGTAGFIDDAGYFGMLNAGNYTEPYYHTTNVSANLFTGTKPGQGTTTSGFPVDNVTYTNKLYLKMNAAGTGISLGTGGSSLAAAGVAINGPSVTQYSYINPVTPLVAGVSTFDEFAFMFYNTTASPITVTLSALSVGNTVTWDASGTNTIAPIDGSGYWSATNINWFNGAYDNGWSDGNNAIFGSGGAPGTVTNVAATTVVANLTFNTNYVITGNALTLTNGSVITVAGSATAATMNATLTGTGGFTKEGSGTLVLTETNNNTYTGDTIINNGTVQPGGIAGRAYIPGNLIVNPNGTFVANAGLPGIGVFGPAMAVINGGTVTNASGGVFAAGLCVLANNAKITNAGGGTSGTYYPTNTDARSGGIWLTRHGFGVFNNLYKSTAGTLIIGTRPNSSGSDGYIMTLNAGAVVIDYAYTANNATRLKANSPLTFAGGMLMFSNSASGVSPSSVNPGTGGTFFNSGASSFYLLNAGAGGGNMTMGAITRKPGATFNFIGQSGLGNVGSTTANVNGIVGGWNTYALNDWTTGTSAWIAYTAYQTGTTPSGWAATDNVSLAGNPDSALDDITINSLRLTAAATVTINDTKTLTLSSGGLLVTGSGATAITGGTLLSANSADLIVHQNASADLTISSTLADNGAATSLTKDGAGKLIITGTDNLTGTNYFNGGVVEVSDLAKLASGPLDMNGGTLRYTGSDVTSARAVATRGLGPRFDIVSGTTVTQSGAITGSGDAIGDLGGITKIGAGTLVLTASNNFNGETVVSEGVLAINGTNNCNPAVWDAGRVTVSGGTLAGTGLIAGPVTVKSGGTISAGNSIGTLTLATNLTLESGSTNLFEVTNNAAGDLLVVQGNLTIGANCKIAVNVLGTALEPVTNTLITYTGTKTGSFNPTVALVGGSLNSSLSIDESTPGQIKLVAVPQVAITRQPQGGIVSTNDPFTFSVGATGSSPLKYQWYFYGSHITNTPVALTDATNDTYSIASAQVSDNGYYNVVVSNAYNAVSSSLALLIVGDVAPQLSGPFDQTVIQGNNATFSTSVLIANPQPTFQWQTNDVDVAGATSTNLTLNNVQYVVLNGAKISVIASNAAAIVTNTATLTVIVTPVITLQPTNITVNVGDPVSLVTEVTGIPTPGLQWYQNNAGLPGETNSTLTIASAQGSNIGIYKLVATNAAGSATSSSVKLTVVSTALAQTAFAPTNGATGLCYDTPLYITFNNPVSIVNSGKIRIYNATNSVTPVDTIDMGSNSVIVSTLNTGIYLTNNVQAHSLFSGDTQVINYFPVIISGSTAAIYPHAGVMTSNQTYYVTMELGVIGETTGAYFAGISDTNAWRFSTKLAGPANPTNIWVAADGSGDFVTVQGAVDSVVPGNTNYTLINIRNGNYVEIVDISGKNNITFRGQSRTGAVVGYGNNANITPAGTTAGRMAFKVNSSDIKLENLTLTNSTPQGGSQAETLLVYNNGLRCVVENCDIAGRQDTILINATVSQAYFDNCKIVGNFDYIWGSGVGYFNKCVIHTITNIYSGSYNITAARTATSTSYSTNTPWRNPNGSTYSGDGFTFVDCIFEADAGVSNITLAGSNGTAGGVDSWANCLFSTAYVTPTTTISNSYVLWQYNNKDLTGTNPVSFANVQTIGVTNNDPRLLAATNATIWFFGWVPTLAPNILSQPGNQTVSQGQAASFTVTATGIPGPSYQWYQDGQPIAGATSATYNIASAVRTNVGSYTVLVSNGSGSVLSAAATLTYTGNVAPVANPSTYTRPPGYPLVITIVGNLATNWTDADADPLALTSGISSTNGATVSYDSSYVYYTNANDVADEIDYTIADGQGGTAAGVINVVIGAVPNSSVGAAVINGNGSVTLSFTGVPWYTYQVEAATDLAPPVVWTTVSTNTADGVGAWQFTDTQATNYPNRYYRSVYR
jgi:autotransporter-associated beta strand protein